MINFQSIKSTLTITAFLTTIILPAITSATEINNREPPKPTSTSVNQLAKEDSNTESLRAIIAHGKAEHASHCVKCHTAQVYTRKNHFVKSFAALSKQVVRCKNSNNIPWFNKDTDAVIQFLNKKYYKF